jgi:alanyl-tRNA synthetase
MKCEILTMRKIFHEHFALLRAAPLFLKFFDPRARGDSVGVGDPRKRPDGSVTTRACIRWCPTFWGPSTRWHAPHDVQKCIRTGDIEEVGDASHLTFF